MDYENYTDTVIMDKKRFEQLTMPRCDIERLRKALKETKRSLLDMQNKIMIDNGAYGEIHPLYKMANLTIKHIDEALNG